MAKAEIKTKETEASVEDFFDKIADETVRADSRKIAEMMRAATGSEPKMWGASLVGFGSRRVKYASGREIDWLVVGFSPRKANFSLYMSTGEAWNEDLLSKLGRHKTGMGCLYIKRLSDVDENILREMIGESARNQGEK